MSETVRIGIVLSSGGVYGVYAHTGIYASDSTSWYSNWPVPVVVPVPW